MKLVFIDKNEELVRRVSALFEKYKTNKWDYELEARVGDISKERDGIFVTASNPEFLAGGGVDGVLAKRFKSQWKDLKEGVKADNLFPVVSVGKDRCAEEWRVMRSLSLVFLLLRNESRVVLTGIGTGIGGLSVNNFCKLLENVLRADLSSADLSSADLSSADLSSADLSSADLSSADLRSANLSFADLQYADLSSANLRYADLSCANLSSANLSSANLSCADLSSANLRFADLQSADLRSANLRSANLSSADLSYANLSSSPFDGLTLRQFIDKYTLRISKGRLTMYKGVNEDGTSPIIGENTYEIGKQYEEEFCNFHVQEECGNGLSVCPTKELAGQYGQKTLQVEVDLIDFVCIPSDGEKVRVKRFKVIKEVLR